MLGGPAEQLITIYSAVITTAPETDFWQSSYYSFRGVNAPALFFDGNENLR
jgi:regulation of enolase protein 1 (concanavalin A-like superfamily)